MLLCFSNSYKHKCIIIKMQTTKYHMLYALGNPALSWLNVVKETFIKCKKCNGNIKEAINPACVYKEGFAEESFCGK